MSGDGRPVFRWSSSKLSIAVQLTWQLTLPAMTIMSYLQFLFVCAASITVPILIRPVPGPRLTSKLITKAIGTLIFFIFKYAALLFHGESPATQMADDSVVRMAFHHLTWLKRCLQALHLVTRNLPYLKSFQNDDAYPFYTRRSLSSTRD